MIAHVGGPIECFTCGVGAPQRTDFWTLVSGAPLSDDVD
jgi:hypothetical protein